MGQRSLHSVAGWAEAGRRRRRCWSSIAAHRTNSASGAVACRFDAQWPVGAVWTPGHVSLDLGTDDQVVTEEARGRSERFTVASGEEIAAAAPGIHYRPARTGRMTSAPWGV